MNTMRAVDLNVTLEGFNFPHKVKAFVGMVNHYMVIKLVKRGGRRGGSTTLEIPIPLEGLLYEWWIARHELSVRCDIAQKGYRARDFWPKVPNDTVVDISIFGEEVLTAVTWRDNTPNRGGAETRNLSGEIIMFLDAETSFAGE